MDRNRQVQQAQHSAFANQNENALQVGAAISAVGEEGPNSGAGRRRTQTPPPRPESPQTPPHPRESKEETKERPPIRRFIGLHKILDVLDTMGNWCPARIEEIDLPNRRVFIHYLYWTSRWDEWIDIESQRLQAQGSRIYVPGKPITTGMWLDVYDSHPSTSRYLEARVIAERSDAVFVHYKGYTSAHDEWVRRDDPRIAPWCSHTRSRQAYKPRNQTYWQTNERKSQFTSSTDPRLAHYISSLMSHGLRVERMGGDGNCLFRSVAHQVYGDQSLHGVTRASAAQYMKANAAWFSSFVVGDPSQFDAYIEEISKNAVWGDDPEIQALCEIYDRPAEIWAYDAARGATRLRVFHSTGPDTRPPIRLSYYGGGHYDSVVGADFEANLLRSSPGEREERVIARAQGASGVGTVDTPEEAALVQAALDASRAAYDETNDNLDAALLISLGIDAPLHDTADIPTSDLEEAIVSQLLTETEHDATQMALLEQVLGQSEEDQLRAALAKSAADAPDLPAVGEEDPEMAAALAMSLAPNPSEAPVLATDADLLYSAALDMTEEEQIEYLTTGVLPQRTTRGNAQAAQQQPTGAIDIEDEALAAAIAASLMGPS